MADIYHLCSLVPNFQNVEIKLKYPALIKLGHFVELNGIIKYTRHWASTG
jgi:hypothetical protein